MHFPSSVAIVVVTSLFGFCSGAPNPALASNAQSEKSIENRAGLNGTVKIVDVVNYLEALGQLQWTQTKNGNRMTTIPQSHYNITVSRIRSNTSLSKRNWGDWTPAGNIAGYIAQYSCYGSGDTGLMGQAAGYVGQACDDLTQASAQGRLINGAWQVWQSAQTTDADGNPSFDIFAAMPWGKDPPQYQPSMCTSALEGLTSSFCASGSGDGAQSQGGGVALGTSGSTNKGAMEFRFDPQNPSSGN